MYIYICVYIYVYICIYMYIYILIHMDGGQWRSFSVQEDLTDKADKEPPQPLDSPCGRPTERFRVGTYRGRLGQTNHRCGESMNITILYIIYIYVCMYIYLIYLSNLSTYPILSYPTLPYPILSYLSIGNSSMNGPFFAMSVYPGSWSMDAWGFPEANCAVGRLTNSLLTFLHQVEVI